MIDPHPIELLPLMIVITTMFAGITLWSIIWAKRNHGRRLYAVPSILLGIHGMVYYITLFMEQYGYLGYIDHTSWSVALRLHETFVIILMLLVLESVQPRKAE